LSDAHSVAVSPSLYRLQLSGTHSVALNPSLYRLQLSVAYMCSSTSAPMAEVISIILVKANMIATSLMIHITLRIVLTLCLLNHCIPLGYTNTRRTWLVELDVKLYLCECHCLTPYAFIIYYVSSFVNRVDHLLLKINRIVISPYCVRVYINGAPPPSP